jgi:GntR family transcriptional regulator, vanillate catabolism transcriptional regulator
LDRFSILATAAPSDFRQPVYKIEGGASHPEVASMTEGPDRSNSSQTLRAVLGVRDLVFNGDTRAGDRLSELALSAKLGLSRTPVRAALARLEQEGLLEPIPSGGYAVRAFTLEDVIDAIELRGVLEGTAARLAAERGVPPARLSAARALLADLDRIVDCDPSEMDFDRYVEKNEAFHELLADLCGSAIIKREIERVMHLPFASPSAFLQAQTSVLAFRRSLAGGQAQHRAIVSAIEMREGSRAEALAREHARLARHNLDHVMEDRALMARVPGLSLVVA